MHYVCIQLCSICFYYSSSFVYILYILYLLEIAGNATRTTVSAGNWDTTQHIQRPQYIYQTNDKIRFIDGRSCAREIDRSNGIITTVIGE